MKTLKERFDEKWIEDKKTGCWEWQAGKDRKGYGVIGININGNTHPRFAHRIGYEIYKGVDPGKLCVCHKCDNPACVNPDCMFLGTLQDNNRDMRLKGRCRGGRGEKNRTAKITERDVVLIKKLLKRYPARQRGSAGYGVLKFLKNWFGVNVALIANGTNWKHVKV